eukprot:scaffold5022_cov20-Prasinocladus_malaysianus.AAC.2
MARHIALNRLQYLPFGTSTYTVPTFTRRLANSKVAECFQWLIGAGVVLSLGFFPAWLCSVYLCLSLMPLYGPKLKWTIR